MPIRPHREDADVRGMDRLRPRLALGATLRRVEEGFSLIELLVVIVIISILAAIAIPIYFQQREKAFVAQAESALKNAATAMQSYATINEGEYPSPLDHPDPNPEVLVEEGFKAVEGVAVTIEVVSSTGYCLEAVHSTLGTTHIYDSNDGLPQPGSC